MRTLLLSHVDQPPPRLGSNSHFRKLTDEARETLGMCIQKRGHVITFSLLALFSLIEWIIAAALVSYVSLVRCADRLPLRASSAPTSSSDVPLADPDRRPLQYNKDHNYPSNSVR